MEEGRLRIFEKRMLRRMFGHTREETAGRWEQFYNEELNRSN
jgi:hypothetical protein